MCALAEPAARSKLLPALAGRHCPALLAHPQRRDARLEYALLLYMNRQYDEAWLQLGILQEQQAQEQLRGICEVSCRAAADDDRVAALREKVWMLLCMRTNLTSRLSA